MLVNCPECGKKISGNAYVCSGCGFIYYQQVLGGGSPYKISAENWPRNQTELKKRKEEEKQARGDHERRIWEEAEHEKQIEADFKKKKKLTTKIIYLLIVIILLIILLLCLL